MAIATIKKILHSGIIVAIIGLIVLYWNGTPLPLPETIVPEISHGVPMQVDATNTAVFQRSIGKLKYTFTPHASYTLPGLVVSLHHSDSWIDISHGRDPAQTVDVCVVWGQNVTTGGYRMVTYDHGDWTCYYRWTTQKTPPFSGEYLSNNHLIPTTPALAKLIKGIKVGDQIILSGELVDYTITGPDGVGGSRNTSLTRTDTGNGACEILYLTDVKILRRNMPWRDPLLYLFWTLTILGNIGYFYLGMPKIIRESIRDFPHTENPFDAKNFIHKNDVEQKVTSNTPPPTTNE